MFFSSTKAVTDLICRRSLTIEFNYWSGKGYCYTIVDSRHRDLLALKDKDAQLMLAPINLLVCSLGKLGFIGQSSGRCRNRLIKALKKCWYQSWGSWVSLVSYSRVESA